MKLQITVLVFSLAFANCKSIEERPQFEDLPIQGDFQEGDFQERSLLSTLSTAASLISSAKNNSLKTNLKTAAGVVADVVLTAATGSEEGAALAKTAIGVAGEVVSAVSTALANTTLANNTLSQTLLNGTSSVGDLLSEYGSGNETVSAALTLIASVTSGNVSLLNAMKTVGVYLVDDALTPTKEKLTIAGTALTVVGGVVETFGEAMSDSANTTTESALENIVNTLNAGTIVNATFSLIDSALNITLEDIISEKLADIDESTSSMKERVVAAGTLLVTVGETLVTIGDTVEDLGDSSVADYYSIITTALNSTSSSNSTST